ncbi:hypothetical protein [Dactylosporangium sp. CA-233914]|uniref:hypothetical protein n=1 Tax=Dactylosporangium sp. CA-233914 TaxID=3239934 RepID=UPI003D8E2AFD
MSEQWVVVVTDAEAVRTALHPLYGDALTVVRSQWHQELLDEIANVLAATTDVCSLGTGRTPDHQVTVKASVLHLPSRPAARLARYPKNAISLTAVVVPAD